jgi:DNA polymerase-1
MIRRAHRVGIAIDPPYFHELTSNFNIEIESLAKDIANYIPTDRLNVFSDWGTDDEPDWTEGGTDADVARSSFNAGSPEQIGKLLYDVLGIGSTKTLKRTKGGALSTGKRQLELVKLEHPVVPLILRHRELRTLVKNYTMKLPHMARWHPRGNCCPICELPHDSDQWRVHGEMGTTRAETGRINHKNPNLGNVPTRTDDGQAVQAGFIAPPGKRLVNRDLSQIELRCLAHLSNCRSMIEVYERSGDIHDDNARKVFRLGPDEKPDKIKHRMAAKRVGFGIQNGTTEKGLYLQLIMDYGANKMPIPDWLTEDWCKWFIERFLEEHPELQEFFALCWYRARRYGLSWDLFGRVRLVPEVRSTHRWIREAGLRQAQNLPVTATAAGQLKLAMGKAEVLLEQMREQGTHAEGILTIHDAIKVECDEDVADDVNDLLGVAMDTCMDDVDTGEHCFRVPITSDGSVHSRWEK